MNENERYLGRLVDEDALRAHLDRELGDARSVTV